MSDLTPEALKAALARCEAEAIQQIGLIQPHGAMIVVAPDARRSILQVSANIGAFFPLEAAQALNQGLAELLGDEQLTEIFGDKAGNGKAGDRAHLVYSVVDGDVLELQTTVRQSGEFTILEFEPILKAFQAHEQLGIFNTVRQGMAEFDQCRDVESYCQVIAGFVRTIIGFDRVMVYRFDADWEGEVIAESRGEDEISYLGNRFPAGDIPPQARALYTKNLVRLVSDVSAKPVPIMPALNPQTGAPLDMSFATLRAFSPVHLEYLRNMGVGASLSVSILQDGRLWGLIACHHGEARAVLQPVREMLGFIGRMVSMKIAVLDAGVRVAIGTRLGQTITEVVRDIYRGEDLRHALQAHQAPILSLLEASGAILQVEGERHQFGVVPPDALVDELVDWLAMQPAAEYLATNHLAAAFPPAARYAAIASGLFATPAGASKQTFALWFRPEKLQTINWAGRPEKEVATDPDGQWRISPRKSFATWSEIWRQHSERWDQGSTDCGTIFAKTLIEAVAHRTIKQREEFYRLFGEQALEMISRHDLSGRIRYASPTSQSILGLTPEQLFGRRFEELVDTASDEDLFDVRKVFAEAVGETAETVFRFRRPDGRVIWLKTGLKRISGKDSPDEIIAVTRDVTDQQQSHLAIEDFQQINLNLLESGGEGIIAIDRDGCITYANPIAGELLGWPTAELLSQHAHNTIHHSHADGKPFPVEDCATTGTLADGTPNLCHHDAYFRRDGSALDVTTATTPIIKAGQITGAIVVFMETGDNDHLSPLIAPAQAGAIMSLDAAGRITSFSDALVRLTGYTTAEALGQMSSILNSSVHSHAFFRELWRRLRTEGEWRGLIWNRCKDGTIRPFWVSMHAILNGAHEIDQYVAIYGEMAVRSSHEAQLLFLASHDSLTGLPNRTQLSRRLRQALSRAGRLSSRVAVGFIDIDHFKEINDNFGHAFGDQFLIEIARRLKESCREEDTMARWGGDEFVFLMEDVADLLTPVQLAERMLLSLGAPLKLSSQQLKASASIGVAVFPDDGESAASLIQLADNAMYQAKKMGGCRVISQAIGPG